MPALSADDDGKVSNTENGKRAKGGWQMGYIRT